MRALTLGGAYYMISTVAIILFVDKMPLLLFLILLYILPPTINCWIMLKNKEYLTRLSIILPVVSTLVYCIIGIILQGSDNWNRFVIDNTVTQGEYNVSIHSDLMAISQIVFVVILYFSAAFIFYLIVRRKWGDKK